MAFNVSDLGNYTIENPQQLIYANIYDAGITAGYMQKQTGVKSTAEINILTTRGVWQTQGCSFTASGDTTFTQETITVGKIAVNMSFCERDLEPKYTQLRLQKGGNYDTLSFYNEITEQVLKNVNKDLEVSIWRGDTTGGSAYLNKFDGLVKIIGAASGVTTYSGTAWSTANSRTVIQGLNALIVANSDVYNPNTTIKYFMSPAMAYAYRQKLITDNLFHINANNEGKLFAEGTMIEIVECPGLAGLNYIYAIEPENLFMGMDMENEQEKLKVWFSDDDQNIKLHLEFKVGVQIAFGSRVWQYLGV